MLSEILLSFFYQPFTWFIEIEKRREKVTITLINYHDLFVSVKFYRYPQNKLNFLAIAGFSLIRFIYGFFYLCLWEAMAH